jgi:hypothetical protein
MLNLEYILHNLHKMAWELIKMSHKIRKNFSRSINWNISSDKKKVQSLSENTRIIANELDKNPIPNKDELNPENNNKS